jgi:hypothetical protein
MKTNGSKLANYLFLFLLGAVASLAWGQQVSSACRQDGLSEKVQGEIAERFPNTKIEDISDLASEYRAMWLKAHASECPGIATGRYKGGNVDLFAILVLSTDRGKPGVKLLLVNPAARVGERVKVLDTVQIPTSTPNVIYTLPPGVYSDAEGTEKVRIPYDGVVLEQLEVGSILYYYRNGALKKLILSE